MNRLVREYRLRTADFDRYDRMLPASIMDIFQDMAGEHAGYIGVGHKDIISQNLFWILLRVKYEVIEYPKMYSLVTAKTWPHEAKKLDFIRDFQLVDENDNLLIKGTSLWALVDISTRKMVMSKNVQFNIDEYWQESTFEEKFLKAGDFEVTEDMVPYEVVSAYTDIDVNGHVNNTKYTNFVLNALNLPETEQISFLQIDYKKEVLEGEKLLIYQTREDDTVMCKGCNEAGDTMFVTKIRLKKTV